MKDKLGHPIFLLSILMLIVNDWYLKSAYGNVLTGKMSDFAGLIAFPYFLSVVFPAHKKQIHAIVALLFLGWNSQLVQPIIEWANSYGIPIGRTIDPTDNFALISILLSYKMLEQSYRLYLRPIVLKLVIIISCFGFVATTIPPKERRTYVDIDKSYEFEISKSALVTRLNMIQMDEVDKLNRSFSDVHFDASKNIFHYKGLSDTLAILLDNRNLMDTDTVYSNTLLGTLIITGEKDKSKITLTKVTKVVPMFSDKNYKEKAIKEFEKRVIKKVRKYR